MCRSQVWKTSPSITLPTRYLYATHDFTAPRCLLFWFFQISRRSRADFTICAGIPCATVTIFLPHGLCPSATVYGGRSAVIESLDPLRAEVLHLAGHLQACLPGAHDEGVGRVGNVDDRCASIGGTRGVILPGPPTADQHEVLNSDCPAAVCIAVHLSVKAHALGRGGGGKEKDKGRERE